ncbi:siderophore-interacting protein [Georgenia sp. Marseille-Q6866]
MTQVLQRTKAVRPASARATYARVVRTERVCPSFVRVVLTGADDTLDRTFVPMGYDQWLRLFLAAPGHELPVLPDGGPEGWYSRWTGIDPEIRGSVRNYTVRAARPGPGGGWEIDIDFVVHTDPATGEVAGVAAAWALAAKPGDVVGVLDQGRFYATEPVRGKSVVVVDESGLPAAEGIARSLPDDERAVFILEVAHPEDRRPLPSFASTRVRWAVREPGAQPGDAALSLLREERLEPDDYVYAVGEKALALGARRWAQGAGLPKSRVDFCSYWRR